LVDAFLRESYNVVAISLNVSRSLTAKTSLVLVDGDIGKLETAVKAVEAAIKHFRTIDVLVNTAPQILKFSERPLLFPTRYSASTFSVVLSASKVYF